MVKKLKRRDSLSRVSRRVDCRLSLAIPGFENILLHVILKIIGYSWFCKYPVTLSVKYRLMKAKRIEISTVKRGL